MGFNDYFIDVKALPDNEYGLVQVLFLGLVYGYFLMYGSNLISDGSELLLLVPSLKGIVGSIVLPILGAVPDGCIVLFSGFGPNAQEQISVGIGALAGSTIMLLTIPWYLSVVGGRVNIDPDSKLPSYRAPKLTPPDRFSFTETGITVSKLVNAASYTMLITSVGYFLLQVPGLVYLNKTTAEQAAGEKNWVFLGLILCIIFFFSYLYQQYQISISGLKDTTQQIVHEEYLRNAIATGKITLSGFMTAEYEIFLKEKEQHQGNDEVNERSPLKQQRSSSSPSNSVKIPEEFIQYLERILRPFFKAYDRDNNDSIDLSELHTVFNDLGEHLPSEDIVKIFQEFDADRSGSIDYQEFVRGTAKYVLNPRVASRKHLHIRSNSTDKLVRQYVEHSKKAKTDEEGEEEEDEDEEIPDEFKDLSPEEQQKQIKFRSFWMMALGTLIVLFFSDPMVDILSEIGTRTGIPPFYIAFIAAPLASNASELIAAYNYAQKKTVTTITISLTTLEGACVMNNTFVLGIFMFLIWSQELSWEYFAETLSILFVEVTVALFAMKRVHTVLDGALILSLYPISLSLVAILEYVGWN